MTNISLGTLQVVLKVGSDIETLIFPRIWTAPCNVLNLSTGPFALLKVECLVSYAELAFGDLLIGLPVLHDLEVDT